MRITRECDERTCDRNLDWNETYVELTSNETEPAMQSSSSSSSDTHSVYDYTTANYENGKKLGAS